MSLEPAQSPAQTPWQTAAILIGRLIFAAVFLMAVTFKFIDMGATAGYIAAAGFPFPLVLAWCAAVLEVVLVLCFLTGVLFWQAALVAGAYVLFLAFAFHGPGLETRPSSAFSSIILPSWPGCCLQPCMARAVC